ncbi:hypothetical protein HRAG_01382 [Helicobacter bilis ATCC 43879]|uniref:SGNH hydrolase-type esterase domain-containing protein n=2 Tax=Helicobacteraceae TaxID=72293 RepID=C3XH36_9HELI|nr:hypothetical protein HRAG_01382 [Helicobacter bilis ATCC 43879]
MQGTNMGVIRFVFVGLLTMLCVCYVYHRSIISYIVQQYHYASDMITTESSFFSFGDMIAARLEKMRVAIFEPESSTIELALPQYDKSPITDTLELDEVKKEEIVESNDTSTKDSKLATTNTQKPILQEETINTESTSTYIQSSDKMLILPPQTRFLLIGDSLMQGIGMVLPRMLQQHGFRTKNLAKQSTGLTYPSFFNWERATMQAFQQYKDIGVLVVCLGANDPWNMPKMRFGTESWEEVYKNRIQAIINIAKSHGTQVVWYAVPMTKNETLNKKLAYLNTLYYQVVSANGGIFLTADAILHNGKFSAYIKDSSGRSRLVRAQDGIHFTPYGSRLLAKTLIDRIVLPKQDTENEIDNDIENIDKTKS